MGYKHKWNVTTLAIIKRLFANDKTLDEVAEELGVSRTILMNRCNMEGIWYPGKRDPATRHTKTVTCKCSFCKKEFTKTISSKAKDPRFCNRECCVAHQKKYGKFSEGPQ